MMDELKLPYALDEIEPPDIVCPHCGQQPALYVYAMLPLSGLNLLVGLLESLKLPQDHPHREEVDAARKMMRAHLDIEMRRAKYTHDAMRSGEISHTCSERRPPDATVQ